MSALRRFLATGVLLLALVAACAVGEASKHRMFLTERDNGRRISLRRGEEFCVRLPAQLGTGYGWYPRSRLPARLDSIPPPERKAVERNRVGQAEEQVFCYRARSAGRAIVELQYVRPWEREEPLRRFRVRVEIR